MEEVTNIIPLNIVFTYPVHWGKFKILRDFVQNFYDSVYTEQWKDSFVYSYDDNAHELSMQIDNEGFSYEWLLHIGASTKTEGERNHAGFFGEGFKIASLCALRDCEWMITMHSRDWKLEVITVPHLIDGKNVNMLAYRVEQVDNIKGSRLVIGNISEKDYKLFITVQDSFYYPQNNLFGRKIWEDSDGAVFERSDNPIHYNLPVTYKYGKKGAVFCSYQMRGTNPFPLVFCLHNYNNIDRDRNVLYTFEVNDIILQIATIVPPIVAVELLERMRLYWNSYPKCKNKIDIEGWSAVVNALIRRISLSKNAVDLFKENNPYLLCASRVSTVCDKNLRRQALIWASRKRKEYTIVKDSFCLLGYRFLEDECEKDNGFVKSERDLNQYEKQCFEVLEILAKEIFCDFFGFDGKWPGVSVITNSRAVYDGMASLYKKKKIECNNRGLKIRYELGKVHIKEEMFCKERFAEALSTYVHELCHVFGGDSSNGFSSALTVVAQILIDNSINVEKAREKWMNILQTVEVSDDI